MNYYNFDYNGNYMIWHDWTKEGRKEGQEREEGRVPEGKVPEGAKIAHCTTNFTKINRASKNIGTIRNAARSRIISLLRTMSSGENPNKKPKIGLSRKSVTEVEFAGKRVVMRVDFNVPRDKQTGKCSDVGIDANNH